MVFSSLSSVTVIPGDKHIFVLYFQENEKLKAMVSLLKSGEEKNGAGAAACCGDADNFGEEGYSSSTNEV